MVYSLPDQAKLKASTFRLQRMQAFNPVRGGHHQTADLGEPLWVCEFQTTPLSRAQAGLWRALGLKLRGKARTVYLYDAAAQRPAAYPKSGSEAWTADTSAVLGSSSTMLASGATKPWGSPRVVEYDRASSLLKLENLAPGATLSPGDFGAWDDGPARRLCQIVEPAIADAAGTAWVQIEPAPPETETYLPAAFIMEKAAAEMVLQDLSAPYQVGNGFAAVQGVGVQILQRS